MPISAAGNKRRPPQICAPRLHAQGRGGGFTFIELMVVVALIAIATAGAVLAMRDSADSSLERDAQRLAAMLESARVQARAGQTRVLWQTHASGFEFQGLPQGTQRHAWLSAQTQAWVAAPLVLGPEPLIGPQRIGLTNTARMGESPPSSAGWWVVTDGLRPFSVQRTASPAP